MQYSLNEKHVDEVGYNYVVVGGFEDRPEHLNKEDYFRVYLNDSENTYFASIIYIVLQSLIQIRKKLLC